MKSNKGNKGTDLTRTDTFTTLHSVIQFAFLRDQEPFRIPTRHHDGDAGYDLYVSRTITIEPGMWISAPTNTAVALPLGTWGMIVGRSSTFHKFGLIVQPCIIDNGWRGELFSAVYNPGKSAITIRKGDRVTQLIVMWLVTPEVKQVKVDELPEGDRGEAGFGSTGV